MAFFGGMIIGVLIFVEGYPLWDEFYKAEFLGSPVVSEMIGSSRGLFTLLLILVALGMFWVGEWAEKRFKRDDYKLNQH